MVAWGLMTRAETIPAETAPPCSRPICILAKSRRCRSGIARGITGQGEGGTNSSGNCCGENSASTCSGTTRRFPKLRSGPSSQPCPGAMTSPALSAWQRGRTGVPIVDAGMRQLWQTGWMHNRVRMVVASFLTKHLLIPWQRGEAWFWDTLVDADLANNAANWQWVAGCGADAAPYFRIFNPVLQGRKFDPGGDYVRRFVPELARLDSRDIHAPWEAPATVLAAAGIELGRRLSVADRRHRGGPSAGA